MHRLLWVLTFCLMASQALAGSPELPGEFARCEALRECLDALDTIAAARSDGAGSDLEAGFAARLEQFGQAAKVELLKRATGDDRGWRNLSGWILCYWKSFDPADVPALIRVLQRNPGGCAARPLGRLGTPEAIQALIEDVARHGASSQSGFALSEIGDPVFPLLLPLLSDGEKWHEAATILRNMKARALNGLDLWLVIALDHARPERDRVGALRGIGILGSRVKQVAPKLRPLLSENDGYGLVAETANQVLAAMADETLAAQTVISCKPSPDPYELWPEPSSCLERAAAFGTAILPYGNMILTEFTYSQNGNDRATAASLLGFAGYAPARQRLVELLNDPDWRVVYAAARALGWLGARSSAPQLSQVARTHWLEAVRREATNVISIFEAPAKSLSRPVARDGTLAFPPRVPLEIDATLAPDIAPCTGGRWAWNGTVFRAPGEERMTLEIRAGGGLPAGTLVGRDEGEFGGEVKWIAESAEPLLVANGNVEGIEPSHHGAVVIIGGLGPWAEYEEPSAAQADPSFETLLISNGPSGSGYALALRRDASGAWRVREIARFPRAAFALRTIAHDLFAAWSGNRAIIFTQRGIAGVAQCVPGK